MQSQICEVDGCQSQKDRLGLCTRHYMRARRNGGDPTGGREPYTGAPSAAVYAALNSDTDECILWQFAVNRRTGYGQVFFEGRQRVVHRAICEKAHGAPSYKGLHAAHLCGVRTCVNPKHLSWKTPLENARDKEGHGTLLKGERNPSAKLTADEVVAIRVLRGRIPMAEICRIFGVTKSAVSSIQVERSWKGPTG